MKIEIIVANRGSVTVKTDEDWEPEELLKLIRKATGFANSLKPGSRKVKQFGFGSEQ